MRWTHGHRGAYLAAAFATTTAAYLPLIAQSTPPARQTTAPVQQPGEAVQKRSEVDTFSATTVNLSPGAGEVIKIRVSRWSTGAERGQLSKALADGPEKLQAALAAAPTLGYIWTSEPLGYSLHYAIRSPLPNGGERIVVATDRRLGVWTRGGPWRAAATSGAPDYPFTVIELRLNAKGPGEGTMSLATPVVAATADDAMVLGTDKAGPVLLKNAKREPHGSQSSTQ